jgi:hypothetical protein
MVLTHPGEDYVNWAEKVPNRDASTSQVQQWIKEWYTYHDSILEDPEVSSANPLAGSPSTRLSRLILA